jgi:hypothetical protein
VALDRRILRQAAQRRRDVVITRKASAPARHHAVEHADQVGDQPHRHACSMVSAFTSEHGDCAARCPLGTAILPNPHDARIPHVVARIIKARISAAGSIGMNGILIEAGIFRRVAERSTWLVSPATQAM